MPFLHRASTNALMKVVTLLSCMMLSKMLLCIALFHRKDPEIRIYVLVMYTAHASDAFCEVGQKALDHS